MNSYRGHVENGIIKLDEPLTLPDGTRVRVEMERTWKEMTDEEWRRGLTELAGAWEDDRTAEEIMRDIREARGPSREIPSLD